MRPDRADEPREPATWDIAMAEHEASLTRGTRVRIMPGEGCHHHGTQEAGVTGMVIDVEPPGRFKYRPAATHPYLVLFDRPLPITRSHITFWYYAAAELTPIPWPTPDEIVARVHRDLLLPVQREGGGGEGE